MDCSPTANDTKSRCDHYRATAFCLDAIVRDMTHSPPKGNRIMRVRELAILESERHGFTKDELFTACAFHVAQELHRISAQED